MRGHLVARVVVGGATLALATASWAGTAGAGEPNCVEFFGGTLANHGQHIVGDYIAGIGHDGEWPPAGQVGEAVSENGLAFPAGQSGILRHGTSPGASFCNGSSSPTYPPGLD